MRVLFTLLDFGCGILNLVVARFGAESPSSLSCFAKVSKCCEKIDSITLGDQVSMKEDTTKNLRRPVEELLNPNHIGVKYVNDLTIASFDRRDDLLTAVDLERILGNIKHLKSFR